MNLSNVEFQIREAVEELQKCIQQIESGTLSARNVSGLADSLGHALDHICLAWNTRYLATHEVGHMSSTEVDRLAKTALNFGGDRQIGRRNMVTWSNKGNRGDGGIASLFHIGRRWFATPHHGCSTS